MTVVVKNLTKVYGAQKAIDQINFEAQEGVILGFLGPNGAGKSTTMKIITGYLKQTSGSVHILDYEIGRDDINIKKIIGYLPENNPLYLDLYVKEYLSFIGNIYKIKNLNKRIDEIINLCGLIKEKSKKIKQLSKGYRQRVGLAKALIHNPKILILDEPTNGLDPNQIIEIRNVIKEVSQKKTVLLSSHIMQEIEALCNHIVIIDKGKIIANDSLKGIKKDFEDQFIYSLIFDNEIDIELFKKENLEIVKNDKTTYTIFSNEDCRKKIMEIISKNDLQLQSINRKSQSIEEIFQELTNN